MANIDDMKRFIQHKNGKFYKNNKYDIVSDKGMIQAIRDILWYSYNKASMQLAYANNTLIPTYLLDKSLDIRYAWNLSLLLDISHICFKFVNVKANTFNEL